MYHMGNLISRAASRELYLRDLVVMVGVIRALLRKKLLPAVISGASGGSIPAALVAVHTDEELERLITPKISGIYGMIRKQSVHIMMRRSICTLISVIRRQFSSGSLYLTSYQAKPGLILYPRKYCTSCVMAC